MHGMELHIAVPDEALGGGCAANAGGVFGGPAHHADPHVDRDSGGRASDVGSATIPIDSERPRGTFGLNHVLLGKGDEREWDSWRERSRAQAQSKRRIISRIILIGYGLMLAAFAGVVFFASQIVGILSAPAAESPAYYVCPEGGPVHKRGCAYVDWSRTDLIRLPGPEASGRPLCEHCATAAKHKASTQSRLPVQAETGPPRIRTAAR